MPLEIKELHIKVAVTPPEGGATGTSPATSAPTGSNGSAAVNQDEIIATVVEQVLQILQEKKEA